MDPKLVVGRNVRRLRKRLGFSQEVLAERATLHRTYIGALERGERNVSLENLVRIARALNVEISELFVGIDTHFTPKDSNNHG
ncbi:MAG TPA: helix-turn-helix transcriptional regulator [Bellilinea sp.]|nr:helix-turn-helix transcriptional regulator [Bellilinea sp.]